MAGATTSDGTLWFGSWFSTGQQVFVGIDPAACTTR
jgi:hypothetical protein